MIRFFKKRLKYLLSPKYKYLQRFDVRKGDVVIDLGANVGEVAEYFLLAGASVYAYEPNPFAFKVLKARTGRSKNIALHRSAVSNFSGTSKLFLHAEHDADEVNFSQGGSLKREKGNVSDDALEVTVEHIDTVLAHHPRIKLIKIDIEGGEYDIMDSVLAQADKIEHILLETHEDKGAGFKEKNDALMEKIAAMGLQHKIYLDWF